MWFIQTSRTATRLPRQQSASQPARPGGKYASTLGSQVEDWFGGLPSTRLQGRGLVWWSSLHQAARQRIGLVVFPPLQAARYRIGLVIFPPLHGHPGIGLVSWSSLHWAARYKIGSLPSTGQPDIEMVLQSTFHWAARYRNGLVVFPPLHGQTDIGMVWLSFLHWAARYRISLVVFPPLGSQVSAGFGGCTMYTVQCTVCQVIFFICGVSLEAGGHGWKLQ